MTRKVNLAAALHEASGRKQTVAIESASPLSKYKPPSRAGKKAVGGHFDPAVIRQLKIMAIDNDSSIQDLLAEALNDLFVKYGQKPIANLRRSR